MTSRREWLRQIATASAANLGAGWPGEILGYTQDDIEEMSDAEYARLIWATKEVQRRLYRIGEPR